ncbi:hypothetical protein ACS0TY_007034 [Phlomoides rotata]
MARSLFPHIANVVKDYFLQQRDATNILGLSMLQKIITMFCVLGYALLADVIDEYINIGESTAIECGKRFYRAIVEIFGAQYLRSPTTNGIARLLYIEKECGFPDILDVFKDGNIPDISTIYSFFVVTDIDIGENDISIVFIKISINIGMQYQYRLLFCTN